MSLPVLLLIAAASTAESDWIQLDYGRRYRIIVDLVNKAGVQVEVNQIRVLLAAMGGQNVIVSSRPPYRIQYTITWRSQTRIRRGSVLPLPNGLGLRMVSATPIQSPGGEATA